MKILAINPGSTSNKISLFENLNEIFTKTLRHSVEELASFNSIMEQKDFRKKVILDALTENNVDIKSLDAVVGRGGLLKPIEGGVYRVNDLMVKDLMAEKMGSHASNLGAILALEIAKDADAESFIVDPVVVDEMADLARLSGVPEINRISIFHALNQKAVARRYARENNRKYEDMNFIIAHMGGGVTVGAHLKGKVVDVNNGLDGEGPFSPERAGGVPSGQLAALCFSGKYSHSDIKKKLKGNGGLVAYLGTNDAYEVEKRVEKGDEKAELVYRAMAYQVSKEIGALSTVLKGVVDVVILTGGVAYDNIFCSWIEERVSHIAKVIRYPGEDEMKALSESVFYAFNGEMTIKEYL